MAENAIASYQAISKSVHAGDLKPWYCFVGAESFFLDRLQDLFSNLIPESSRDFNYDLLYGKEQRMERILSLVREYPMMSDRRVVIVRDFLSVGKSIEENTDDAGSQDLINYLENPNPSTILVLIDEHSKPSGNTKLGKALKKSKVGVFSAFEQVPPDALPSWITDWADRQYQRAFDLDAAQLLAYQTGDNLLLLSKEIDKLCTFKDSAETISADDVRKISGFSRSFSVFDLKNAILKGRRDVSLHVAEHILQQSDQVAGEVIRLLSFFYGMYARMWQIRRLEEQGKSPDEVQRAIGGNPRYVSMLKQDARKIPTARYPDLFEALFDADKAVKGFSKLSPESVLYMTIEKLLIS